MRKQSGSAIHEASRHATTIAATATAVPPHVLAREDVKTYMRHVFDVGERRLDAMMTVIDNAQVHKRHSIFPIEYIVKPRPLAQTSREYREHAVRLGQRAAEACLANARITPHDIDLIITVSCTGFMIPSLDAHLINLMGFRSDVRRMPLTELGCAAGAMALARASEFVRAFPDKTVLIVSVELATLTFQRGDLSQANLISCVLFGDGAAAAVVTGRPAAGPQILDAETYTFPDSLDAMAAFILHPGGQKLLSYIEEQLVLCRCDTQLSWDVLGEYGNLSSATILFILHALLTKNTMKAGEYGLAAAFGPGFSAELLLLRWV
jgi:alkylresorcinol/alkylpyrone synthase